MKTAYGVGSSLVFVLTAMAFTALAIHWLLPISSGWGPAGVVAYLLYVISQRVGRDLGDGDPASVYIGSSIVMGLLIAITWLASLGVAWLEGAR